MLILGLTKVECGADGKGKSWRNTQKNWETMRAQIMKRSGWDLKKIKRIETYAEQNKACEADMEESFSCEPVQIKSYSKEQEDERVRHYEKRNEKEEEIKSRGLRAR